MWSYSEAFIEHRHETIILHFLTILKWKNCFINKNKNGWLAASDLFDMFTQSIKFYYIYIPLSCIGVQMFEKCDSSNRQ